MALDVNLMLRDEDDEDLDAAETSDTGLRVGVMGKPLTVVVNVPEASGSMAVKIQQAADNGSDAGTYENLAEFPQITAAGIYRLSVMPSKPWLRHYVTDDSASGSTGIDFGATTIGLELGGRYQDF